MTYDEMSLKLYNEKKTAIYIANNNDLSFAGDVCMLISGKYLKVRACSAEWYREYDFC